MSPTKVLLKGKKMMSSNRIRVSPYPLRSTRTYKQIVPVSPIEAEGPTKWEDVRCVICMEPPHNAVLLHCSSTHKGCRPYICDTSARHSNCFKQFRKDRTTLNCPYCRGEVYETVKVSAARRFMNAKPRSCSVGNCEFSGSYSKLNAHSRAEHPDVISTKVDQGKQQMWEDREREIAYNELMAAAAELQLGHGQEVGIESFLRTVSLIEDGVEALNYANAFMQRWPRA